jgi:hypothetical protein
VRRGWGKLYIEVLYDLYNNELKRMRLVGDVVGIGRR